MQASRSGHASWRELLASPAPSTHILQVYDSEDFLATAVAFFAAEGLRRGEAVRLTGTPAHLYGIRRALLANGFDADGVTRDGRLQVSDVHQDVAAVMSGNMPNPVRFQAVAGDALEKARADSRFTGVRWWGEMSNVLHQQGNVRAAMAAEGLGDAAAKKHGISLFCSFLYDKFDARGYEGILKDVCGAHTHVIPADDYARYRLAVTCAVADVAGGISDSLRQSFASWKGLPCDLPSSQAILFWARETMPQHFDTVLARAKAYQAQN
jgi:hypothetical protein